MWMTCKFIISLFCIIYASNANAGMIIGSGAGGRVGIGAGINGAHRIPINVWVLFGQSNTAAADACINPSGCITDLIEEEEQEAADQSALLYCYSTAAGQGIKYAWGDIRGYPGSSFGNYVDGGGNSYMIAGTEVAFNRDLYTANSSQKQAFIKFYGNYNTLESGHSAWYPGNTKYTGLTAFIDSRLSDLQGMGYSPAIMGFVYHQGIDDGILHRSQVDYGADITAVFAGLRAAYGSGIPVVIIRSVNSPVAGTEYMAPIRAAQVEVAGEIANAAWVSNDDLEIVNYHHLSFAAHLTLGRRVYTAMYGLTPP